MYKSILNTLFLALGSMYSFLSFAQSSSAEGSSESSAGVLFLVVVLLALLWSFTAFGNFGDWIEAKKDLAKEEARRLKLENDERELRLKDSSS